MNKQTLFTKKTVITGLVTSVLFLSFTSAAFAGSIVSVKGENVNIRTGPSKNKPVYMELSQGYPLKIVKRQGDWVKVVDYEHDSGWIHASLVGEGNTVIVNGKTKINMRARPSKNSNKVAEVYRGVVMTKISQKGKWVKVKHDNGLIGWIFKPLLWP